MLEIVFLFAFYGLLQKLLVDWPATRRMRKLLTTNEAIALRRRIRSRRRILFGAFLLLLLLFYGSWSLLADWNAGHSDYKHWTWVMTLPGMLWVYLHGGKNTTRLLGHISLADKGTFLAEHPKFALYLRGFAQDDYTPEGKLDRLALKRKPLLKFSEYLFTKTLVQRIPVCAIGMTKEISSPSGAERIYVDDATWRDDVRELMEKAESIFILVNDSPSCVWEILASRNWLGKTVLVIDDIQKYEAARAAAAADGFMLPALMTNPPAAARKISTVKFQDGGSSCGSFDNSLSGYAELLGVQPLSKRSFKRHDGWGCLGISLLGFLILSLMIWAEVGRKDSEQQSFRETIAHYKESRGLAGDLSIRSTTDGILFVPPEESVEIVSTSPSYTLFSQTNMPGFHREAIYAHSAEAHLEDEIRVVASCQIWSNMAFSSLSFKMQMEAEKKALPAGKVLWDQHLHDCEIAQVHYEEYVLRKTVITASDATREHFAWSVLEEERIDTGTTAKVYFTLFVYRFVLVREKALLLYAQQTSLSREDALALIPRFEDDLDRWENVIRAVNSINAPQNSASHKNQPPAPLKGTGGKA